MTNRKTLEDFADDLDKAPRMGEEGDNPEGSYYIQISDTLAKQIAEVLRYEQDMRGSRR